MRIKEIEFEGQKFRIGALTIGQAKDFLGGQTDALKGGDAVAMAKTWRNFIVLGLNNGSNEADPPWTEERLEDEIDLLTFDFLRNEILEFSGMKLEAEKKTESPAPTS